MTLISQKQYKTLCNLLQNQRVELKAGDMIHLRAKYEVQDIKTNETLLKVLSMSFKVVASTRKQLQTNKGDLTQDILGKLLEPFLYIQAQCVSWRSLFIKIEGEKSSQYKIPLRHLLYPLCATSKCDTTIKQGCRFDIGILETQTLHGFKIFGVADFYADMRNKPLEDKTGARYINRIISLFTEEIILPLSGYRIRYQKEITFKGKKQYSTPYISFLNS